MGRLDHVHIRVPDRAEAADWYAKHLGFEPVAAGDFWATGIEGGPLHISADGGKTGLALFEVSEGHPMVAQQTGVAFSVDADTFIAFARSLPSDIDDPLGERLACPPRGLRYVLGIQSRRSVGKSVRTHCYDYEEFGLNLW